MINYRGTPLFGEDSSVSHTSEFFAIAGTVLFWLLFLIFSFIIKPQPKKQFKEVQIVLSSTPVVQKTEEAPAPAEAASASAASSEMALAQTTEAPAPAPEPVQKPAAKQASQPAAKKTETPKTNPKPAVKKEAAKTQNPQKAVSPSKPVEEVTYSKSVEELMEEQFSSRSTKDKMKNFDEMFADDEPEIASTSNPDKKIVRNDASNISGVAGTGATTSEQKVTSSSNSSNTGSQKASSSTSKTLEGIKNSIFKGNAANGVQSETSVKTKTSGSGRVEMEMSNGRSRALLDPAKPIINLSAQAAATIDAKKTVKISFIVLDAGNVRDINITPEAILSSIVREEIKSQISKWRFEPADYSATATFEYNIVKN